MRKSSIASVQGMTTPNKKRPEMSTHEKRRPLTPIQMKGKGSLENENESSSSPTPKVKLFSALISNRKLIEKSVQTDIGSLITSEEPTQDYWKLLAEERRVALEEALQENQTLTEKVETLQVENDRLNELIEDAKTLAEMINDLSEEEDHDESGIGNDGDEDEDEDDVVETSPY